MSKTENERKREKLIKKEINQDKYINMLCKSKLGPLLVLVSAAPRRTTMANKI